MLFHGGSMPSSCLLLPCLVFLLASSGLAALLPGWQLSKCETDQSKLCATPPWLLSDKERERGEEWGVDWSPAWAFATLQLDWPNGFSFAAKAGKYFINQQMVAATEVQARGGKEPEEEPGDMQQYDGSIKWISMRTTCESLLPSLPACLSVLHFHFINGHQLHLQLQLQLQLRVRFRVQQVVEVLQVGNS